ncbi:hypothetical protein KKP97_02105 [Methanothermococcus sp. SCGC AD-155-C09]|nr:hypothetical protein [Methanothermococcus sp. SCGC AD-155-C09]
MKLSENKIKYICLGVILIGIISLSLYNFEPEDKKIKDIKEGDYVKITGHIQSMKLERDKYRYIKSIKYIKIMDDTGGDLRVYPSKKVREDLVKYITNYNPSIKEGDIVQVIGTIQVYNGIYTIYLEDISDFRLIEKKNFERDIYLSTTPTGIYASKYGKTYHTIEGCPYGKRIVGDNIIYFYTEKDAKELNYKKCKYCASK